MISENENESPREILYREVLDAYRRMSQRAMDLEQELHAAKAAANTAFTKGVEAMRALAVAETNRRRYACSSCATANQIIIDLQTAKVEPPR